jgi:hypothetical protein
MNKIYLKILQESILLELSPIPAAARNDPWVKEIFKDFKYLKTRTADQLKKIKGLKVDLDLKEKGYKNIPNDAANRNARLLNLNQQEAIKNNISKANFEIEHIKSMTRLKRHDLKRTVRKHMKKAAKIKAGKRVALGIGAAGAAIGGGSYAYKKLKNKSKKKEPKK